MKNQIFLYLTSFLVIGILLSEKLNSVTNLQIYFVLLLFSLFISLLVKNKIVLRILFVLQFSVLGFILHQSDKSSDLEYYKTSERDKIVTLKFLENYSATDKYLKYKAQNLTNQQIAILNIPVSTTNYYPSDTLIIFGSIHPLTPVLNPNQFDYKNFLNRKKITHSVYTSDILKVKNEHNNWKKAIIKSKEYIRNSLAKDGYTKDTRAIISSMLLGDRTEVSDELNKNYVATGVIHILSISGLHVVMIYIILQFLLQPLLRLKNGRRIQIITSLIIIWLFAIYVDLHPPVFRAALMITIYYMSELLKRPKNIYHTLALSAFIILIFQPNYLFDVGFQLSFSAVFFIVWLNPIYKKWFRPQHKISKYFYELSTTSLSAQLGTMPFSTLYFNQFSGLFLLGNLILVPASFFMIIGAMIAILLCLLGIKLNFYINSFNWFIATCNNYLKWLSTFDIAIFKQVYISGFTAVLLLIILYLIRPLIVKHSKIALIGIICCFVFIQINRSLDIYNIRKTNELIIFHDYKNSLIAIRKGQTAYFFTSINVDSTKAKDFTIKPFLVRNRIRKEYYYSMDTILKTEHFIKSKNVLLVNNQTLFLGENLTNIPKNLDYLLIRNSSFNPTEILTLHQTKRVITDGSNYPNYILNLENQFKNSSDSLVWKTSENGYFHTKF